MRSRSASRVEVSLAARNDEEQIASALGSDERPASARTTAYTLHMRRATSTTNSRSTGGLNMTHNPMHNPYNPIGGRAAAGKNVGRVRGA